jgi:hypothetical protein
MDRNRVSSGRLRHLLADERGMSFAFVGLGFMATFAASMLAIDVGLLMTARTQAQRAADAGALAGATALTFNSFTDHSATGPAVVGAVNAGLANQVIGQAPSVTPADVTFPPDPLTGESDLVQVSVYRTTARGNPIGTFIAQYFGMQTVEVQATATAGARAANAEKCVLPFTIPDKWIEMQCGPEVCPWGPNDGFDMFATQGNHQNFGPPLVPPDLYIPPGQPGATGYQPTQDVGIEMVLKSNALTEVTPSFYNPWDIGGVTGADAYRNNIGGCNPLVAQIGDTMTPETGNMVGPTKQGTDTLIASDPSAYWDTGCNCVKGSAFVTSPRIRAIPLYNPILYAQDQHSGKAWPTLQIVNYLGFFIESVTPQGEVTGRITPITGSIVGNGPPPTGGFARAIQVIQ